MVDFASLGQNVREEKLLDCLDLLEIMADPQFIYELLLIFESAGFLQAGKRQISSRFILDNGVRNAYFCEHAAELAAARRDFILP